MHIYTVTMGDFVQQVSKEQFDAIKKIWNTKYYRKLRLGLLTNEEQIDIDNQVNEILNNYGGM